MTRSRIHRVSEKPDYLHGYSESAADRLITQARFFAPYVFKDITFEGAQTLYEVGVGVGAQTRIIRQRWPHLRILGVDISAEQIERARQVLAMDVREGQVELLCASGTNVPLPTACADAAFVCFVLAHVPDPTSVLRECARIVRPGGRVVVVDMYCASLVIEPRSSVIDDYWSALCETLRLSGGHPNIGIRLADLAEQAGLGVTSYHLEPVLGDRRDREQRAAVLRYFRALCRGAEPRILATHTFAAARLESLWSAWDAVERADDAVACNAIAKLEAHVLHGQQRTTMR